MCSDEEGNTKVRTVILLSNILMMVLLLFFASLDLFLWHGDFGNARPDPRSSPV